MRAVAAAEGLSWLALRYFNVAGTAAPELADRGERNLVPLALRAVADGRPPLVFGADYDTPDGSCVRDYIHVSDLASAHVAATQAVVSSKLGTVLNVGTGKGHSVFDVLAAVERATGRPVHPQVTDRRVGDPAMVVADPARIRVELGWQAEHDLDAMVSSAWAGMVQSTG